MSKSFLYSLFIHLLLAAVILLIWMRPISSPKEEKMAICLTSAYQPIQPVCACDSLPSPSKPISQPLKPVKAEPIIKSVTQPSDMPQNPQPTPPITVAPESKPLTTPLVVQTTLPPSVRASAPSAPPINAEKEYLKLNLAEIRALLIQNQQYPKQAKRLRIQGDVELHFQLNANGSVEDMKIVQSSGFEILDEDAKALVLKTAPFFPKPSSSVQLRLPIGYLLH